MTHTEYFSTPGHPATKAAWEWLSASAAFMPAAKRERIARILRDLDRMLRELDSGEASGEAG